jgi:hypothetical protein
MICHLPFWVGFGLGCLAMFVLMSTISLWLEERTKRHHLNKRLKEVFKESDHDW